MQGLLKTYAKRLVRRHMMERIKAPKSTLETEDQLLEMALSRIREALLSMEDPPDEPLLVRAIRQEASFQLDEYEEADGIQEEVRKEVESLPDDCILPRVH